MKKEMSELLVNLQEQLRKQKSELDWWKAVESLSLPTDNVDASACSYADGDEE